jgi:hypothetical protein
MNISLFCPVSSTLSGWRKLPSDAAAERDVVLLLQNHLRDSRHCPNESFPAAKSNAGGNRAEARQRPSSKNSANNADLLTGKLNNTSGLTREPSPLLRLDPGLGHFQLIIHRLRKS